MKKAKSTKDYESANRRATFHLKGLPIPTPHPTSLTPYSASFWALILAACGGTGSGGGPKTTGKLVTAASRSSFEGQITVRDLQNIKDGDDPRYNLDGASGANYTDAQGTDFIIVTGKFDHSVSVFEFDQSSRQLTFRDSLADDDISPIALQRAVRTYDLLIGDTHHIYVTSYFEDAITRLTLTANGQLQFDNQEASVIRDSQNSQYALESIWTMTHAVFDTAQYFIASGNDDTGFSVFRIGDDGNLTFVRTLHGSVTADDGSTLTLNGSVHGQMVKKGDSTFYVGAMQKQDALIVYEMTAGGSMSFVHAVKDSSALGLNNPVTGTAVHINGRDFILMPSVEEDAVTIFELSSTGRLSHIQTVFDHENTAFELDGATDVSAVQTDKGMLFAVSGKLDDGVSIFHLDANGRAHFITSIEDNPSRALDNLRETEWIHLDDGGLALLVVASDDDGISLFEIDFDDPAGQPAGIPALDVI